jgi:hypothetical protein
LAGTNFAPAVKNMTWLGYSLPLKDSAGASTEGSFRYERNGQVVHANIRFIDEFEWYLAVEQPEQETIRQIHTTLLMNLGICVAVTLVVLVLINAAVSAYQKKSKRCWASC